MDAKAAGECVAAAFIAMEQFESEPGDKSIIGRDGQVIIHNVSLVRDKTGRANWMPAAALTPRIITAGNGAALRFGRASQTSGALIAQDAYETFPENGIYSMFVLYRIPLANTEGYGGTGGNMCGNYATVPDWLRVRFGSDFLPSLVRCCLRFRLCRPMRCV